MNTQQHQLPPGTLVRFLPEFADGDTGVFVVVHGDEGKGRVDVSPQDWPYPIRPLETVPVTMLEMIEPPNPHPEIPCPST